MKITENLLRVVIQDRRRLIRDGLAALLDAEPDIVVAAAVEQITELAVVAAQADVWICADRAEAPPDSSIRVLRLTDEAPSTLLDRVRHGDVERADEPIWCLTPRETQIMHGVASGMSTASIGAQLGISPKTVENHKQRVFAKLGVQSQTHALVVAHAAGLLERTSSSA